MATSSATPEDVDYFQLASDSGKQFVSTLRLVQTRALDTASTLVDQASTYYDQAPASDPARAVNLAVDLAVDVLELQRDLLLRLTELLPTVKFGPAAAQSPASTKKVVTAA